MKLKQFVLLETQNTRNRIVWLWNKWLPEFIIEYFRSKEGMMDLSKKEILNHELFKDKEAILASKQFSKKLFKYIIGFDPTENKSYSDWILTMFFNQGNIKSEDFPVLMENLKKYIIILNNVRNKNSNFYNNNPNLVTQRDLNLYNFKRVQDLYQFTSKPQFKPLYQQYFWNRPKNITKDQSKFKTWYDGNDFVLTELLDYNSACAFLGDTNLCTKNLKTFREYRDEGVRLFVLSDKIDDKIYSFGVQRESYKKRNDTSPRENGMHDSNNNLLTYTQLNQLHANLPNLYPVLYRLSKGKIDKVPVPLNDETFEIFKKLKRLPMAQSDPPIKLLQFLNYIKNLRIGDPDGEALTDHEAYNPNYLITSPELIKWAIDNNFRERIEDKFWTPELIKYAINNNYKGLISSNHWNKELIKLAIDKTSPDANVQISPQGWDDSDTTLINLSKILTPDLLKYAIIKGWNAINHFMIEAKNLKITDDIVKLAIDNHFYLRIPKNYKWTPELIVLAIDKGWKGTIRSKELAPKLIKLAIDKCFDGVIETNSWTPELVKHALDKRLEGQCKELIIKTLSKKYDPWTPKLIKLALDTDYVDIETNNWTRELIELHTDKTLGPAPDRSNDDWIVRPIN